MTTVVALHRLLATLKTPLHLVQFVIAAAGGPRVSGGNMPLTKKQSGLKRLYMGIRLDAHFKSSPNIY